MSTTGIVVLAIIVLLLIIAAALVIRRQASQKLRSRFGAEYERAVEDRGGARQAEADLAAREKRVRRYGLKDLSPDDRQRFTGEWRGVQSTFVDDPKQAAERADDLVGRVMTARGYPGGEFDQRLEDLSVDHATAVQDYRMAHEATLAHARGEAGTEDMRRALLHLRTLFEELVGPADAPPMRAAS